MKKILFLSIFFLNFSNFIFTQNLQIKAARKAKSLIGYKTKKIKVNNKFFNYDCSGLVAASYYPFGIDLIDLVKSRPDRNITVRLYKEFYKKIIRNKSHIPNIGDLIFFQNTYDKNKNNKWDDGITHIGIVTKVDSDKTIHFVHLIRKGIMSHRMNLNFPKKYIHRNKKVNDFLRRRPKSDNRRWRYLASNFFNGFLTVVDKK